MGENALHYSKEISVLLEVKPTRFLDSQAYLESVYDRARCQWPTYSLDEFSQDIGIVTPGMLNEILSGQRSIDENQSKIIADTVGLEPFEKKYFLQLVKFNNSQSDEEHEIELIKLMKLKGRSRRSSHKVNLHPFFSTWYTPVIYEMVGLPDFNPDPAWIAIQLKPNISLTEARASFELLQKLGLVERDSSSGRYQYIAETIDVGGEAARCGLIHFHEQMIDLAKDALQVMPAKTRDIGGLTLRLQPLAYKVAKTMIHEFQQKLLALEHHSSAAQKKDVKVFQINTQLFPLTNGIDECED